MLSALEEQGSGFFLGGVEGVFNYLMIFLQKELLRLNCLADIAHQEL